MLLSLNISNFAVFENVFISFDSGFNVFTGETGSGKTILIEAIRLILGERASKELIRKNKNSAYIEGIFDISGNDSLYFMLKNMDIKIDKDDFLIISRELMDNGKSINKLNGRTVPLNTIKTIGSFLIDIYGQFGHESLFKKENHIKLLDSMIHKELSTLLHDYNESFLKYNKLCKEIEILKGKLLNKEKKIEQIRYEIDEIDDAQLKESEEDELLKKIKKLSNIQEIKKSLYEAIRNIHSDSLNNVYSILNRIQGYDEKLEDFLSRLDIQLEELKLLSYDLRDYSDSLDIDEKELINIENRMSLINRLKRKYGFSIEKINELSSEGLFSIMLSHRPEYYKVYETTDVNLILSGHAHGGQFRIPFVGGLVAPTQGLLPEYDSGVYQEDEFAMVVSRGIGNSIIPVRFNNQPEVIIIELRN